MALPTRARFWATKTGGPCPPSFPHSYSLPSGSLHKPLIFIHQRVDRRSKKIAIPWPPEWKPQSQKTIHRSYISAKQLFVKESESEGHSVVSNSLRLHGLYSPWYSPGQNTGVGSLCLFQGSNPDLPHCRWILYQLSHKGSPRVLEWVAYPFSSKSSWPRNWTGVSWIAGRFFTNWAIREEKMHIAEGNPWKSWYVLNEIKRCSSTILHGHGSTGPHAPCCCRDHAPCNPTFLCISEKNPRSWNLT